MRSKLQQDISVAYGNQRNSRCLRLVHAQSSVVRCIAVQRFIIFRAYSFPYLEFGKNIHQLLLARQRITAIVVSRHLEISGHALKDIDSPLQVRI